MIALKRNTAQLSNNKLTPQDTSNLNCHTIINSVRGVFSINEFQDMDIKSIAEWFERRPKGENWIAENHIHMEPFNYPIGNMSLSFI